MERCYTKRREEDESTEGRSTLPENVNSMRRCPIGKKAEGEYVSIAKLPRSTYVYKQTIDDLLEVNNVHTDVRQCKINHSIGAGHK